MLNTAPKSNGEDFAAKLLALLDHAYDAAENPNGFDQLFLAADEFFFPQSAIRGLTENIDDANRVSDGLDGHIKRIQTLIDRGELDQSGGARISGGPQLANLVVSADGTRVIGNGAAETLLACRFPVSVNGLGLTALSADLLLKCLSDLRTGHFEGSSVITLQHLDQTKPYLAKCTKLQSRDPDGTIKRGLSVTINHVDWRKGALDYAATTFSLTRAETDLLGCLLEGLSYPEAATQLDKSRETVRAQGKSILRKTGSTQIADVVQFMTSYAYLAEPTKHSDQDSIAPFRIQGNHFMVGTDAGRKIQVNRYGLSGGRPLLFFHGLYQGPYLTDAMDSQLRSLGYDVIAPSRPGFNRTDPPIRWDDFNATVTEDVLAVCDFLGLGQVDFVVHHAGISFACRAAGALNTPTMPARVRSAIMIGAGVPIKDYMLKTMNVEARVAGAAAKYAPKLLDMLLRVGIAKWRRQGPYAYLSNLFPEGSPDRETLNNPETGPVMERGVLHMISQGAQTIMYDGFSAMSDWEPDYNSLPERQLWLHGAHDSVMNPTFVQEFLSAKGQPPAIIYPDRGGDVLLGASEDIIQKLHRFLSD